jgi:serine/threonine-protein phosphatase PP1 catalytic subunit
MKVFYPDNVFLIRGNHETQEMTAIYGFKDECALRHPQTGIYDDFIKTFEWLPLATVVGSQIFCVHGGLSEMCEEVEQIKKLGRPLRVPDHGFVFDLLWSDPKDGTSEYEPSARGARTYGNDAVEMFLYNNRLDFIVRAHETAQQGWYFPFKNSEQVITLFSAPNYGGTGNYGAIMKVAEDLKCSFEILAPAETS